MATWIWTIIQGVMNDIPNSLSQIMSAGSSSADQLLPLVYKELRNLAAARLASERPDHTLQATALVHEAYLRLLGSANGNDWENRGHFFAAAAEAMRRILVESARSKQCLKRGGGRRRVEFLELESLDDESPEMLLDIDEALTLLAIEDAESAKLVQMRLFAGLSVTEAGKALGMSRYAAYENWAFARSWLAVHFGTSSA